VDNPKRPTPWIYLTLACLITWSGWLPAIIISRNKGYMLPTMENYGRLFSDGFQNGEHVLLSVLFSLAVYGPLLAGLIAARMDGGAQGVKAILSRMTRVKVGWQYYLAAILSALALLLIPGLLGLATGLADFSTLAWSSLLAWLIPMLLINFLTSGLGEEPGWRGYLLPALTARLTTDKAIWFTGLAWALWHYPVTIFYTLTGSPDMPVPALITTLVISLAGQTISLIGMMYIYAWLYQRTGSLFLLMFFHALTNVFTQPFSAAMQGPLSLLVAAMPWLVVLVLERIYGKNFYKPAAQAVG